MTRDQIREKIVNSLKPNPHGLLVISPRFGKSRLAIDIIKRDKPKKVLWVTPNTKLKEEDIPNEFVKWDCKTLLKSVEIVTYSSLHKVKGEYEMIILDEYQNITNNNCVNLLNRTLKYKNILGLSGTPPKHNDKLDILTELFLFELYEMSIEEAVQSKIIADYNITVYSIPLNDKDKNSKAGTKEKPFFVTERANYDYITKDIETIKMARGKNKVPFFKYLNRMRFIHNVKSKHDYAKQLFNSIKGRTLLFTSSINLAEDICKDTYHSKTTQEKLDLFIEGKIDKLACVNAGGTGFTFTNIDNLIVCQTDSNMSGNSLQKMCRSLVYQGDDYKANIIVLCCKDTVDEEWVVKSLEGFDPQKVRIIDI